MIEVWKGDSGNTRGRRGTCIQSGKRKMRMIVDGQRVHSICG